MHTILVVDDVAICREPIAEALRHHGYNVVCAADGHAALSLIRRAPPDLVLLDVSMPDIDGIGVLRAMRRNPASRDIPVILVTDVNEKDRVLRARELGAQGYMLKSSFALGKMLAQIGQILDDARAAEPMPAAKTETGVTAVTAQTDCVGSSPAAEANVTIGGARSGDEPEPSADFCRRVQQAAHGLLHTSLEPLREATMQRLDQLGRLKALAGAVAEVIRVANSPTADRAELATALMHDSVLTARVLQVANSAAYHRNRSPVRDVEQAIGTVGFATVRNIATTVGIFDSFALDTGDGLEALRCWQHCLAVAKIMERITPPSASGVAHLLGLCHDLGEIVLRQYFANEYQDVTESAARTNTPMDEAEVERFGLSHRELTCLTLDEIGLPREIADPIRQFWTDPDAEFGHPIGSLARALRRANNYAHGLLFASTAKAVVSPISRDDYEGDLRGSTTADFSEAELRAAVVTSTQLLARRSPSDGGDIDKPLLSRTGVRICYVRDPSLVALDPLGTALHQLVQVDARGRLPTRPEDLVGCSGLVVAAPDCGRGVLSFAEIDRMRSNLGQPTFPVLCLVGQKADTLSAIPKNIRVHSYPIALDALAASLSEL